MTNEWRLNTHKERLLNDATINFKFIENDAEKIHRYKSKENPDYKGITSLLKEMGISPSYENVDKETLEKAKKYGKFVHSEIENYVKQDEIGISEELENFKNYAKKNGLIFIASEYRVHNDKYAGSIDLIYSVNGELVISDIKTTSQIHTDSVSWQLSLYRYLLGEEINKGTCIHIKRDLFEVKEIPLKSNEECEALLKAYENGEKYSVEIVEQTAIAKLFDLQEYMKELDKQQKQAKKELEAIKDELLVNMQERNLVSVELSADDKKLKITRVMPKDKESIDYEKLLKDNPSINIDNYKVYTPVKEYIKIS